MVPLTVRSHYSLMWGTTPIRELCRTARRLGYERLAMTDTDNLYGLWTFLSACEQEGIRPIVGAEVTDQRSEVGGQRAEVRGQRSEDGGQGTEDSRQKTEDRRQRTGGGGRRAKAEDRTQPGGGKVKRAVCLVEDEAGYRSLCRLLTRRHMEEEFSLEDAVTAHAQGLTVLTTDPGLLTAWHDAGVSVAAAMPRRPVAAGHSLRKTAQRLGVPVAATPGSFFLVPEDREIHCLLRAIAKNTALSLLLPEDTAPPDAWFAGPEEYARRFAVCPEALRATLDLSEKLSFTGPGFGVVFPPWQSRDGQDAARSLRDAAYEGARKRYGQELSEPVVERLEHELRMIADMGFSAYFLVVREIVSRSPRTCGRGSGAASLVSYCLSITNVCPIKHNLYFERFLNPGRQDPPDIDVDFAWDERDGVIGAVLSRYAGHAAMVSNHVLFQPRMAIRETAKVFGLTDAEIGDVTRRLPWFWHLSEEDILLEEMKKQPELQILDFPEPWPEILRLAHRIIGTPRYLSVHPGGVVITPDPIDTYVPLERAPKGVPVIQWEKDGTEEAGLVKIDLLGNRSLGVIRDAVKNLRANGIPFDEARWEPEDDLATQEAVAQGKTMGCFYIESPAMRLLQQKSRVGDFEHLVIHSSIIRPAANDFIREYIRRLHGGQWEPIHPLLSDVLSETFGIMVYQEDVSRTAVAIAGFSHAEADRLRKILSKKDREYRLKDFHEQFCAGAKARGVSEKQIQEVWSMMMSFDGYSFCKPHSASYARVSFQAAFLKVHHPAEFMAGVISNQGGFYSTFAYVSEARRLGLSILAPDVNESEISWTGNHRTVRVGLLSVKGLSAETAERIVSSRTRQKFAGMEDFLSRVRPAEDEARALIHCGALDSVNSGENRAVLIWELARRQKSPERKPRPGNLFGEIPPPPAPVLPPEDPMDRLRREFAVLGFLCDRHPMELYEETRRKRRTVKAADIPRFLGKRIRFAGWLITGKVVHTKHGDPMEFVTFEDETGIVETTFFPEAYRRFCHMTDLQRPYLLSGKVEEDWGALTLTVDKAERL